MSSFKKTLILSISIFLIILVLSSTSLGDEIGEVLGDLLESDPYPESYEGGQYNENEYWVYIQPKDDITTPEMIKGRTQKGDIVDIIPTSRGKGGYVQSNEFLIIKVSNLSDEQKARLLKKVYEEKIEKDENGKDTTKKEAIFERKYRLDLDSFKSQQDISKDKGTVPLTIDASEIIPIEKSKEEIASYEQKARFFAKTQFLNRMALNVIPKAKAATTNTFYVDPDAAAGGNGTTNALSGANCAFQSLSIWENARDNFGGLVAADTIEEAVCDSNGESHTADSTGVVISGWTTGANNYIYIHTPTGSRHNGTYDTSKYRLELEGWAFFHIEDYVKIDGLQTKTSATAGSGSSMYIGTLSSGANKIEISNNIFTQGTVGGTYESHGVRTSDSTDIVYVWNNILYDFKNGDTTSIGLHLHYGTSYAYNNTVVDCAWGIRSNSGNVVAKNNIIKGSGNDFSYYGTFSAESENNATDSTDDIGAGSGNLTERTFTFVNEAGDDFHLASGDAGAKDAGVDLNPDPDGFLTITTDIDGETRPDGASTWDIGADEYVAPDTAISNIIIKDDTIMKDGIIFYNN